MVSSHLKTPPPVQSERDAAAANARAQQLAIAFDGAQQAEAEAGKAVALAREALSLAQSRLVEASRVAHEKQGEATAAAAESQGLRAVADSKAEMVRELTAQVERAQHVATMERQQAQQSAQMARARQFQERQQQQLTHQQADRAIVGGLAPHAEMNGWHQMDVAAGASSHLKGDVSSIGPPSALTLGSAPASGLSNADGRVCCASCCSGGMSSDDDLGALLRRLGLEKHLAHLQEQDIDSVSALRLLSDEDLKVSMRKVILLAYACMRLASGDPELSLQT